MDMGQEIYSRSRTGGGGRDPSRPPPTPDGREDYGIVKSTPVTCAPGPTTTDCDGALGPVTIELSTTNGPALHERRRGSRRPKPSPLSSATQRCNSVKVFKADAGSSSPSGWREDSVPSPAPRLPARAPPPQQRGGRRLPRRPEPAPEGSSGPRAAARSGRPTARALLFAREARPVPPALRRPAARPSPDGSRRQSARPR